MSAVHRPLTALTLSSLLLLGPAGCGIFDDDGTSPRTDASSVNTGLSRISSSSGPTPALHPIDTKPAPAAAGLDINLSEVIDGAAPVKPAPAPKTQAPAGVTAPVMTEPSPATQNPTPTPALTPDQRLATAAADLRAALQDRLPRRPFADALSLTMLDLMATSSPPADHGADLAPSQRRVLTAVRSLLSSLATGSAADGDPTKAADLLDRARTDLAASQAVRISRVVLCKKVTGFGQYEPFGSTTFVAGRTNRVVVYAEVENFAHRPAREGDPGRAAQAGLAEDPPLWTVELSQELWMTHDADGTTQWRRPEQTITEVSRNRRHDFYLVQQIDLPPTLSVGRFILKVILRDKVTGAADERTIPITIVADAETAARAPAPAKTKK